MIVRELIDALLALDGQDVVVVELLDGTDRDVDMVIPDNGGLAVICLGSANHMARDRDESLAEAA